MNSLDQKMNNGDNDQLSGYTLQEIEGMLYGDKNLIEPGRGVFEKLTRPYRLAVCELLGRVYAEAEKQKGDSRTVRLTYSEAAKLSELLDSANEKKAA